MLNLIVNARDAMPGGGSLRITANLLATDSSQLELRVSDSGQGIPKEIQALIWEPFYSTKGKKGTGLGLSTVIGIIRQSGGNISCHSKPGEGTEMVMVFPVGNDAFKESTPKSTPAIHVGNETILVVDDEDAVLDIVSSLLVRSGYTVLTANGPQEAIKIVTTHTGKIHLLLSDVVMPVMAGVELAEHISHFKPRIKVMLMTGALDRDQVVNLPIIQKPFAPNRLLHVVRKILDGDETTGVISGAYDVLSDNTHIRLTRNDLKTCFTSLRMIFS